MRQVYVTRDGERRICDVVTMLDADNEDTDDPKIATAAVIKWDDATWLSFVPGEPIANYIVRAS